MLDDGVRGAIAPLEPGYAEVLARVVEHVERDTGIRALWLGGSVGRGVADAGSDLDLVVTVADRSAYHDPSVWDVLDPVITTPIPGMPGCFAFTTRDGLRVDIVLETPEEVASSAYVNRLRVLDRDGLEPPAPAADSRTPDVERMQAIVTEFLRQSAIFPAAVVAREDWLLGQAAVQNYGHMLYQLLVESNQPLPVMGVKQWSSRLTADQRDLLASLPAPAADRDSVVAAMRAVREAIRTRGRAALESAGGTWPTDVDDAMAAYWRRHGL
ncbi:MAG TPA: nucleotidyltransferase domain-containing protein [Nocardioides sp.]|uniref:nucleotidyltransferase domain-containing protein n=1 Tax=Nocardioides sp. TaxID=35761 RepID=UPI002F3F8498